MRGVLVVCGVLCLSAEGLAQTTFKAGSLVIPMDTTYQDSGMLKAYGLVYALLKGDLPIHWVIKAQKALGAADVTVSSKDFKVPTAAFSHGYRGGPFVVEAAHAAKASPIITAWQAANPAVAVHVTQADVTARTGRLLTAAPTIAVIGDGSEAIAFKYLNAAGIPDRLGALWTKNSPDVLTIAEVAGPTTTKHDDGALFRPSGKPNYCQIMTMHWGVNQVVAEVVEEYRAFLQFPVHMMAECQAVNAIENHASGRFITTTGFLIDNNVKDTGPFEFLNLDTPFVQIDGSYNLVGGSERAYSLPPGGQYHDKNVVMIKDAATTLGQRSIWMTGYIDGKCLIGESSTMTCLSGVGKVSYLGGHEYEVKLPISANPDTQGTRLFLNSLFEAACATEEGQPTLSLVKVAATWTGTDTLTYTLSYQNPGPGPALDVTVSDALPTGASYVSSTGGGTQSGGTVTWKLGDVGAGDGGSLTVTVKLASYGSYQNSASATLLVGLNTRKVVSNTVTTVYSAAAPDAGVPDLMASDVGPGDAAAKGDGLLVDGTPVGDGTVADAKPGDAALAGDKPLANDGKPSGEGAPDVTSAGDASAKEASAPADGKAASESGRRDGAAPDARGTGGGADSGCNCALASDVRPGGLVLLLGLAALVWLRRRR
jgi:uncharacterized repeat protein (TIGR01451 family)/MYXO-CTERM domain-containing protein